MTTDVFKLCSQNATTTLLNIKERMPSWLKGIGRVLRWDRTLPYAYILPKESKSWLKVRPIVSYTNTWLTNLGNVLSMCLRAIAQAVFERMEFASTVQDILRLAWNVVRTVSMDYRLTLFQQDIAGFYNAVPHDQICTCVRILVDRFVRVQSTTFEQVLSVSKSVRARLVRAFRGKWKRYRHQVESIPLTDILPLVHFFLRNSYLRVGSAVLLQTKGASMGSPCAPIFCGCVDAVHELLFRECFQTFLDSSQFFLLQARYVDTRALMYVERTNRPVPIQLFCHEHFYGEDLVLENVSDEPLLGFRINELQRTITARIPEHSGQSRSRGSANAIRFAWSEVVGLSCKNNADCSLYATTPLDCCTDPGIDIDITVLVVWLPIFRLATKFDPIAQTVSLPTSVAWSASVPGVAGAIDQMMVPSSRPPSSR